jgi:hypothetical protein
MGLQMINEETELVIRPQLAAARAMLAELRMENWLVFLSLLQADAEKPSTTAVRFEGLRSQRLKPLIR